MPAGLGLVCALHVVPSQCNTSVRPPSLPTAVHEFAWVQVTAPRVPWPGEGLMYQAEPLHRSARVTSFEEECTNRIVWPTATQSPPLVQATPLKVLPCPRPGCEGPGLGTVASDHAWPSHRSARPNVAPAWSVKYPTAIHASAAVHDTAVNAVVWLPAGLASRVSHQPTPFHRSAMTVPVPRGPTKLPTAMHMFALTHETAVSEPCGTGGFGAGLIDQPEGDDVGASAPATVRDTVVAEAAADIDAHNAKTKSSRTGQRADVCGPRLAVAPTTTPLTHPLTGPGCSVDVQSC